MLSRYQPKINFFLTLLFVPESVLAPDKVETEMYVSSGVDALMRQPGRNDNDRKDNNTLCQTVADDRRTDGRNPAGNFSLVHSAGHASDN